MSIHLASPSPHRPARTWGARGERGSVMVEYVAVLVTFSLAVVLAMAALAPPLVAAAVRSLSSLLEPQL